MPAGRAGARLVSLPLGDDRDGSFPHRFRAVPAPDPTRPDRTLRDPLPHAGRRDPARRQNARSGAVGTWAEHRTDRHLCRLPSPRPRLRARRRRRQRRARRSGDPRLPAKDGRACALRHLGVHRIAGARRRGPAAGPARRQPLALARSLAKLRRGADRRRVTIDGNIITGGGVTAGIDFALRVVEELHGKAAAEAIQLMVEYDPHPPFDAGSPERAGPELVERIRRAAEPMLREREAAVARAAEALQETKT